MEFEEPPVAIFLFIVAMVTCLMLTVVNMYKNGCCFMYRLRQDVEDNVIYITFV
ncbi:hypothetical protein DPMN_104696 [Dreissena polymorpha]|uniref:Uncharacterized protein n=1 Tax=Dreissena polymorpha TaxID=45954 RepID=A0A9D4H885_DREPO|nr:hypothetical protein DPMN_104696 [Dreissena polymorpha]